MSVTGLDFAVTVSPDWGTKEYKDFIREAVGG
jgi:hypothetical protein